MRARRALITLLAGGLTAAAAVPALAHTEVISRGPKRGAVVKHLPKTIILNFTEAPQRVVKGQVLLAGKDHAVTAKLNPKNARQVRITTKSDTVGKYTVKLTLIAPDGDNQLVTYKFRVAR
jgi:methionine-rich copper-binding protein CopC